jgi:hypothetical protein
MLTVCLSDAVRRVRAEIKSGKKEKKPAAAIVRSARRSKAAS